MKTSELARIIKMPISKIRRLVREILPPDPQAKIRSGYCRELSLNEAFEVAIAAFLVSELRFEVVETKAIIILLKKFLRSQKMYPQNHGDYFPPRHNEQFKEWEVAIFSHPETKKCEFVLLFFGYIHRFSSDGADRFLALIKTLRQGEIAGKEEIIDNHKIIIYRTLRISKLLNLFMEGVKNEPKKEGRGPQRKSGD